MNNYIFNNVNKHCYYFKTLDLNDGLYDSFVDMTYILLMENSEREKHVYEEINKFRPTKKVKIQYNKGYKKCRKKLCEKKVNWDLFDAHYNVMLDAYRNNYNNILILEDDFVINKKLIFNKDKIKDIEDFINGNKVDVDLYLLGTISFRPNTNLFDKHQKCSSLFNCHGTHSFIIKKVGIEKFLLYYNDLECDKVKKISNGHIDDFFNKEDFNTFLSNDPLVVQPLEMTENRKENWNTSKKLSDLYIKTFDLDNKDNDKIVKSYNNRNTVANLIKYFVITLVIYLLYKIFK